MVNKGWKGESKRHSIAAKKNRSKKILYFIIEDLDVGAQTGIVAGFNKRSAINVLKNLNDFEYNGRFIRLLEIKRNRVKDFVEKSKMVNIPSFIRWGT